MKAAAGFRTGVGILAACLLGGWIMAFLFPLRSTDQWFAAFVWGSVWRTGGFLLLWWADRSSGSRTALGFSGTPAGRVSLHAAVVLGLWSLLLTRMSGAPWPWSQRLPGLLACLTVGLFEEYLFRGVLLDGFLDRFGGTRAALASSVLFMLYHTRPQAIAAWPHIFLTGAVFAGLRLRGMSLGHLALIHAAADSLFFFHGRQGPSGHGPAYWLFLAGLFVYAAWALPSVPPPGQQAPG